MAQLDLRGVDANVDIDFGDIFRRLDMIFALRAEADKGPFGIYGELLYMSLSDSAEVNRLVQKVDVRVDQFLVDGGLSWRFVNQPRCLLAKFSTLVIVRTGISAEASPNEQSPPPEMRWLPDHQVLLL